MIKAEADVNEITYDHVFGRGNCVQRMLRNLDRTLCMGGAAVIKFQPVHVPRRERCFYLNSSERTSSESTYVWIDLIQEKHFLKKNRN